MMFGISRTTWTATATAFSIALTAWVAPAAAQDAPVPAPVPVVTMSDAEFDAAFTSHTAEVNGISMHYRRGGSGDESVILIHGWPNNWYVWRTVMPTLAADFDVIAVDLRGIGGSTGAAPPAPEPAGTSNPWPQTFTPSPKRLISTPCTSSAMIWAAW